MSIYIGNNKYKEIYLGSNKISEVYLGSNKIFAAGPAPIVLPPLTIRVRLTDWYSLSISGATCTQVSSSPNIWDVCTATGSKGNDWSSLFSGKSYVIEVLGANTNGTGSIGNVNNMDRMFMSCSSLTTVPLFDTSNVTTMINMFNGCRSLTTVPLFDTSRVIYMQAMFGGCSSLTSVPLFNTYSVTSMYDTFNGCTSLTAIPLFNTSRVTDMYTTFYNCTNVQSGALALYQQASTQATPPSIHTQTFRNCGSNTTTGAAELAQIPSSWK